MDFLNPYTVAEIPILELLRNLSIGVAIAVIWAYIISKSTRIIVDTSQYLPMFLMLIPGMILIITIIKSSIALSLGLVGALSIVRFRTPIKEPEELLYIFIAIAVGLGLGANQIFPTLISFAVIVLIMLPYAFDKNRKIKNNSIFVDIVLFKDKNEKISFEYIKNFFESRKNLFKTKRIYQNEDRLEVLLELSKPNNKIFDELTNQLKKDSIKYEISFADNSRVIT